MSFLEELKRRNVTRVAVLYLIASWLILQVSELLFEAMGVPAEWLRFIIVILIVGFPVAFVFSWVYEVTPDGIRREKDISPEESITAHTGKRINVAIIVLLVAAIGGLVLDRLIPETADPVEDVQGGPVAATENVEERSIAVLPFRDMSPGGDQEYFSDGIAEEILNVLVRVDDLSVASRTTSFGFKGQESLGIPYMADKMDVRHVLEGSVRKSGDAVRVTAQLIDASNDKHLWSETYDRQLSAESIFEIQDDIAQAIVTALGVIIDSSDTVRGRADTQDINAYEAYLVANQLFLARTDLPRSIALFEQAVASDPGFARAWAGLAAVAAVAPSWDIRDRDYDAISDDAANKAIAIDDSLSLPYAVLGLNETDKEMESIDFEQSISYLEQSLQRNDKEATTYLWRGMNYMRLGYFDKALADLERCLAIDPAYRLCRRHLANTHMYMGNYDLATGFFLMGIEAGFVRGGAALWEFLAARGDRVTFSVAKSFWRNGRGENLLAQFDIRAAFDPDYDFENERAAIEATYKRQTGRPLDWSKHPANSALSLQNYASIHDATLPFWWHRFPESWRESEHPRRMIMEVGLPDYWRKYGFPPHCEAVGEEDFKCDLEKVGKKRGGGIVN